MMFEYKSILLKQLVESMHLLAVIAYLNTLYILTLHL